MRIMMLSNVRTRKKLIRALISLIMLFVAVIWVLPLVMTFFTSFKSTLEVKRFAKDMNIIPKNWILVNYEDVLHYPAVPFFRVIVNTVTVCLCSILGILITSTTAAYAFERLPFKGSETLFWVIFTLSAIPNVVALVPQYNIYKAIGWIDNLPSIIAPLLTNIFYVFLVRNFLKGIPKEFDEAGRIDGASEFYIYLRIMLPMLKPVLMVLVLFTFQTAWNDFMWPTIAITTPSHMTITPSINLLSNSFGNNPERLLAGCMLAMIPTFLIYLTCQKYFLAGMQLGGGVKG